MKMWPERFCLEPGQNFGKSRAYHNRRLFNVKSKMSFRVQSWIAKITKTKKVYTCANQSIKVLKALMFKPFYPKICFKNKKRRLG